MEGTGEDLGTARWKKKLTGRISYLSDKKSISFEYTLGKKMVAVLFILMPCEPNTAFKAQRKQNFYNTFPYTIPERPLKDIKCEEEGIPSCKFVK